MDSTEPAKWSELKYEISDIVIEFKNGLTIVVNAKDVEYSSDKYNPYRRQIDDYMEYANAKFGVLIFSRGDEDLWIMPKSQLYIKSSTEIGKNIDKDYPLVSAN